MPYLYLDNFETTVCYHHMLSRAVKWLRFIPVLGICYSIVPIFSL